MHFDFTTSYLLENDRVRLSPLEEKHIKPLQDLSLDADIWTYFLEKGQGGKDFQNYIKDAFVQHSSQKEYPFVVFDKRT